MSVFKQSVWLGSLAGVCLLFSLQGFASDYQRQLVYQCLNAWATAEKIQTEDAEMAPEQRRLRSRYETAEREIRELDRELEHKQRRANNCDRQYSPVFCNHLDNEARIVRNERRDIVEISNRLAAELNRINDRATELKPQLTAAAELADASCGEALEMRVPNSIFRQQCRHVDFEPGSSILEKLQSRNMCE
ncbi:hypothetical protein [Aliidiomarina indica]|uniref:hypothetical protein n=1 Tax=Aliidiomarina indica TaxID=2749147 RepID=UPI00188ED6F3|nr:hypothetical protein [Aliidiomarina indica]